MFCRQSGATDHGANNSVQLREFLLEVEAVFKRKDRTTWTRRIATGAEREEAIVEFAVPINDRLLNHRPVLLSGP